MADNDSMPPFYEPMIAKSTKWAFGADLGCIRVVKLY